ncbi:hypothetical protein BJF79_02855 [Actinomadura sp. CNU-125]|uniref:hypothetical protein n=1 Tax=Actinomadura sp. CNU-125 TaxID=1904961 RepID=UPI00095BA4CF|nr:hypothetical protein [Actinomadura sp. CNU-125]OLT14131.1 hypothetical protein BJF79_02855 [Actinomadura sp. CNU-125]
MAQHTDASAANGVLRPALWLALAIGLVGNVICSATGLSLIANIAFSLISTAAVVGLVVHHYRSRKTR